MPAIPLHHISFTTGSIAHIYTKGRWTPQSKLPDHRVNSSLFMLSMGATGR